MYRSLLAVMFALVPSLALAQPSRGTSYAFLVGCSGYDKSQFKPLPYTVNDVEGFRRALLDTGFDSDHIKMLHDKRTEDRGRYLPERAKIVKEFDALVEGLDADDTIVVALSGHGVQFKGEAAGYFCPIDAKVEDRATLIRLDGPGGLFERLERCKARRRLLLVNACRNDPVADLAQASRKVELVDEYREAIPEGIAALYSCRAGQKSYFDPKRERGLFFDHLIRAWTGEYHRGEAPLTLEEVFQHVKAKTKSDADANLNAVQIPEVKRAYTGDWVIPNATAAADRRKLEQEWQAVLEVTKRVGTGKKWYREQAPKRLAAWQAAMERGDQTATLFVAVCLQYGYGTEKDERQAARIFEKLARAGHPAGMLEWGYCRDVGLGTAKNLEDAFDWYRKSAEAGVPHAMVNLGDCYWTGDGTTKDSAKAYAWFRRAADTGSSKGFTYLANCYAKGIGVAQDSAEAVRLYRKAIEMGNPTAMNDLGRLLLHGDGVAMDQREAINLLLKAAENEEMTAYFNLGICYANGWGVARDDREAFTWYKKGAEAGHPTAMNNLGHCYDHGLGVAADGNEAYRWFRKSAEKGDETGMFSLGVCYENGRGVSRDLSMAIEWYRKSAAKGYANANQALRRLGR